ncbi:MAG: hypothetical protein U0003_03270 [Vampirovibrionales bacterium]
MMPIRISSVGVAHAPRFMPRFASDEPQDPPVSKNPGGYGTDDTVRFDHEWDDVRIANGGQPLNPLSEKTATELGGTKPEEKPNE